jgi:hypothetical protein
MKMDEFVVITDVGNGFKTKEEAIAYAKGLNTHLWHPAFNRDRYVMQLVETVRRNENEQSS